MPLDLKGWQVANKDRALAAFEKARSGTEIRKVEERGSEMVRSSKPSLQDGPRPPAPMYNAVKASAFNARWERERKNAIRNVRSRKPSVSYEDFMKSSGVGMQR